MSISAKYTSSGAIVATVDGMVMTIPTDLSNRDYAALIGGGGGDC